LATICITTGRTEFVGQLKPGRWSDSEVTKKSVLVNRFKEVRKESTAEKIIIHSDKGGEDDFQIEGVEIWKPSQSKKNTLFAPSENLRHYEIARARITIEQSYGRVKKYFDSVGERVPIKR